jgi:hypothetical protein
MPTYRKTADAADAADASSIPKIRRKTSIFLLVDKS